MTELMTPKVDLVFKKLFGVEENKDLLISLINSIVSEEDQVAEIILLKPYNPQNFRTDKLSILDIKAKSNTGKLYNIEIQISDEADYDKRALYYWGKLYTQQLKKSDDYSELNKAIGIHILNFTSIPEVEKYHNIFHLLEKDSKIHFFKDIELHTIELKKFENNKIGQKLSEDEEVNLFLGKIKTSLDRWVAFLSRCDLLRSKSFPAELKDAQIKKALHVLDEMRLSDEEREAYEDRLKWLRMEVNATKKAEEKGRAKGITIGIEKEKVAIAGKLLEKGMSISEIASITELPIVEIQKLKERI
ncbi:MAG: Rpn family recombination-promoting nuclease/putative transposase [Rickettsiales bacterium]|nr:Rpn family recombination-promoting nuclease/putative transposase [Rickettsiales bacterium]